MAAIYVIVTNSSSVIVGKDVIDGDTSTGLSQRIAQYPLLTFTTVPKSAFDAQAFVGPNYAVS